MGLIREPKNVDFYVDPTPLTEQEKEMIHEAIAYYNATGKIKTVFSKKKPSEDLTQHSTSKRKHKLAA